MSKLEEDMARIIYCGDSAVDAWGEESKSLKDSYEKVARQLILELRLVQLDTDLYWEIAAILKGMQMRQKEDDGVTWYTTLDYACEKWAKMAAGFVKKVL